MTIQINAVQAAELLPKVMQAKLVAMLHGSPAIGKSAIIHQLGEEYDLEVIDLRLSQMDPTDLLGFPHIDENTQRAGYLPMKTFPLKGDPLPKGKKGWIIFCDEFNHAAPAVQKAAYKLILDRMVGQFHLHERAVCVAAGNLDTDNAMVEDMPTPLQSRMVHFELVADDKVWLDWAAANNIDHRITSFIRFKPGLIYDFEPEHTDRTYASPRTWAFLDRLIHGQELNRKQHLPLIAGTVGEGVAREFLGFTAIFKDLPTMSAILSAPEKTPVPEEPSVLFALTGAISHHAQKDTIEPLLTYVQRLPMEFQVITLRDLLRRKREFLEEPAIQRWIAKNSSELF